ncbi:MAG: hypothetical protein AVDCRST_MAG88-1384 [uncultured Thermomicrobiales bacterium]|uniref:Response regulatory domain-containing protein n=1 Tax=uncultured Thermomicrobiales bacterium TaxID=1645740 RepID=A0A6J4UYF3_9BACT|nr:MAG: hypothetical protein AVDCRST_MAG88-1384 [uncultured Thermomicrobiales bacterium]
MSATTFLPRIVVVDDDELLAELLQTFLADLGYDVAYCPRGDEAFAFIQAHRPDAIILDLRMGEVGGLGVLHLLATDPRTARIPVLLCTGVAPVELQAWDEVLTRMGVPILFKPFTLPELAAAVRALLPSDKTPVARRP